ncbi:MAG: carboxypeptidase-like regulatory domain-containing protein, partial [Flavobacteriales bacterium]
EDGRTGYFSSERAGGLGGQDIYEVVFPTSQIEYLLVRGVVTNSNEEPLKARIILTRTGEDEPYGIYNTNANTGRYVMAVRPGKDYHVEVSSEGFVPWEYDFHAGDEDATGEMILDVPLVHNERTAGATPQH